MVTSFVPSGNVASTWTSSIISGTPSITSARVRMVTPAGHEVGDGAAVAGALEDLGGDERDGLRVVELEAARAAAARQLGGDEDEELFLLARCQVHGWSWSDPS